MLTPRHRLSILHVARLTPSLFPLLTLLAPASCRPLHSSAPVSAGGPRPASLKSRRLRSPLQPVRADRSDRYSANTEGGPSGLRIRREQEASAAGAGVRRPWQRVKSTVKSRIAAERLAEARKTLAGPTPAGQLRPPRPAEKGFVRPREEELANVGLILPNVESILEREREAAITYGLRRDLAKSLGPGGPRTAVNQGRSQAGGNGDVAWTLASKSNARPNPFSSFPLSLHLQEQIGQVLLSDPAETKSTPIQSLALNALVGPPKSARVWEETRQRGETPGWLPSQSGADECVRVVLGAETGSGKTMAYMLPLLHRLKATQPPLDPDALDGPVAVPRALVLAPTHELTRQSTRLAKRLTAGAAMRVIGTSSTSQGGIGGKTGPCDVLFGTEGMVRKCLGMPVFERETGEVAREVKGKNVRLARTVDARKLDWVVIDEADIMLGRDFAPSVLSLLAHIQTLRPDSALPLNLILVSATFPSDLSRLLTSDPVLAARPFLKLLSPGLHRLPTRVITQFHPYTKGQDPGLDVVRAVVRALADDARERAARAGARGAHKERAGMEKHEGDDGVDQKSRVVVFANSAKQVDRLAQTMQDKGLGCVTWAGQGAYVYKAVDALRAKAEKKARMRADAIARATGGAQGQAAGDYEDGGGLLGKERLEQVRIRGKDGVLAQFLALPGTRDEQERIARRRALEMGEEEDKEVDAEVDAEEVEEGAASPAEAKAEEDGSAVSEDDSATPSRRSKTSRAKEDRVPRVLITTSILSRGLDFHPSTSTVVLMDRPKNVIDFVHRAGRVGRVGPRTGGQGRFGRVVLMGASKGEVFGEGPEGGEAGSKDGRGRRGGKQERARARKAKGPTSWAGVRGVLQRSEGAKKKSWK